MGGMVKEDCNDPEDKGEFCWSDSTQALVLGAYFYGYAAQFLAIFFAKRLIGSYLDKLFNSNFDNFPTEGQSLDGALKRVLHNYLFFELYLSFRISSIFIPSAFIT